MKTFHWYRSNVSKSKNFKCITSLLQLKCMTVQQNANSIRDLTEGKYSTTVSDEHQITPPHKTLRYPSTDVAHCLIKSGGNINVQNMCGNTLLHEAVKFENLEAICMLLYYGADVNIVNNLNNTAFMDALRKNNVDIILTLINFCDERADKLIYNYYISLLSKDSDNGCTLIKQTGSDKILVENFLRFSHQIDPDILLHNKESFLEIFLQTCTYAASDWLKCLYLILDFPNAVQLIEHWNFTSSLWMHKPFTEKKVERPDRVAVIWTWLSLGGLQKPGLHMWKMIWLYGFAEEMEALLYCSGVPERSDPSYYICSALVYPFVSFNLTLDDNLENFVEFEKFRNYKVISLILEFMLNGSDVADVAKYIIIKSLKFFSLPYRCDEMLGNVRRTLLGLNCQEITQQVETLPTIPSLVEQGRNEVRKIILQTHCIHKLYQFYDIVKQLHVPPQIKDIILFRKSIY